MLFPQIAYFGFHFHSVTFSYFEFESVFCSDDAAKVIRT